MGINTPVGTSAVLRRDRGQEVVYALQGAPAVQVQDCTIGEFQNHDEMVIASCKL